MADNSTLPVNGGTEVFANDDIAGVKWPRVKVTWGVDGAAVDASASNPLPVTDSAAVTAINAVTSAINSNATAAIPTGTNSIGAVTQGGTWTVGLSASQTVGIAAGSAAIGTVGVTSIAAGTNTIGGVVVKPSAAAGGQTLSRVNAAATTNATSLKASAGNIVRISVFNVAAYTVFLKLYNKASAPTVGTDTPTRTIPIPAGTGFTEEYTYGRPDATGVAYAITKLQADSDTTAVAAGDLTGEISWI